MDHNTDMTCDEAQDALDNDDTVTASELQEMYPDKTMTRIEFDMATEQAELELESKIQEKYEFNEPRMAAKQGRKTCHSGPKGVLTDYEEAKLKWRAIDIDNKMKKEKKVYMQLGTTSEETLSKLCVVDAKMAKRVNKKEQRREHPSNAGECDDDDDDDDDEEEDDDDDEAALLQYKLQRMKLLEESRPRYGDTKEVTAWTFEAEVDEAPHNVWVVIHVYQDYLERCGRMNYALAQIAKSYPHIKFLRARSDRLGLDTYPEFGLPTLIVFKNGKQLQNHIALHKLLGTPFQVKDVEAFLIEHRVIQPLIVIPDVISKTSNFGTKQAQSNVVSHESDCDSELDID